MSLVSAILSETHRPIGLTFFGRSERCIPDTWLLAITMRHLLGVRGHNVQIVGGSSREVEPEQARRPLGPAERHARFGLVRRAPGTETEWFQRHWFAFMVPPGFA